MDGWVNGISLVNQSINPSITTKRLFGCCITTIKDVFIFYLFID